MQSALFHPLGGRTQEEVDSGEVRVFRIEKTETGLGTPYLKVPGLKALLSVRVGNTVIPMEIAQRFPANNDFTDKIRTSWPMVSVVRDPEDGQPVLLRSVQSNDGIWQEGVPIYVGGEWEEEAQAIPPSPPQAGEKKLPVGAKS